MPNPGLSEEEARAAVAAVETALRKGFHPHGSPSAHQVAARLIGKHTATLTNRLNRAKSVYGLEPDWTLEQDEPSGVSTADIVSELESENHRLKTHIATLTKDEITRNAIRTTLLDLKKYTPKAPRWTAKSKKSQGMTGVPILFASDWQLGEVIRASEINNFNSFNLEIAEERIEMMMQKTVRLLFDEVARPKYPGIVLLLGGDMVSGDSLHDDLTRTNEQRVLPVFLRLIDLLIGCVDTLLGHFEHIHVVSVPGNHGRLDRKPPAKERNVTNFDWLAGVMLERHYQVVQQSGRLESGRVTFQCEDSPDAYFEVYGRRYCLTHGDQFRGGDGMIGPIGPVMRGRWKKAGRDIVMQQPFDTLLCGHFHWLWMLDHLIINGSLPGYSEYAYQSNLQPTQPAQALWIQHQTEGITHQMPIYLDKPKYQVSNDYLRFKV